MAPVIRPAREEDLDAIAAIYAREVLEGYASFETEPPPRSRWEAKLDGPDHLIVADLDGRVAGYAYSGDYRPRAGYRHTREVSVYVDPSAQGRGVGRALYDDLIPRLRADGHHLALAGVALPNPASVRLHEAVGFEQYGVQREVGRKLGRWIDVAWFQLLL